MNLFANSKKHQNDILSLQQILGIVIVFSFVLYLLFPKGDIENIVLHNEENTNLSINYLESILLYHPDNIELQLQLIKNYRFKGELGKAIDLNNKLLLKKLPSSFANQVEQNHYLLLKDRYFSQEHNDSKPLLSQVQEALLDYFNNSSFNKDYLFFFTEATQMDITELEYIALKNLMNKEPVYQIPQLQEQAFYLSIALKKEADAYIYLQELLQYPKLNNKIAKDALNLLMHHQQYQEASAIATELFLKSSDKEEQVHFFNMALYAMVQNPAKESNAISNLIEIYQSNRALQSDDILTIIDTLLKVGLLDEVNSFVEKVFNEHPDQFNNEVLEMAIKGFIYKSQLSFAQTLATYAYEHYPSQAWLDMNIQLARWMGDTKKTIAYNLEGYQTFKDSKYETYFLKEATLDTAYEILGTIYQQKIQGGDYTFVDKLAEYYEYIGEIPKAEQYFLNLYKKVQNEPIGRQAILFSYYNNHLAQGIAIYDNYKKRYGLEKWLQELTIEKLIALKAFKKAQYYTQELETTKTYNAKVQKLLAKHNLSNDSTFYAQLIDLSWRYKKYEYLFDMLWKLQKQERLELKGYEKLILLEKALNDSKRLTYLYQSSWKQTRNNAYLLALLSEYLSHKNQKAFHQVLSVLSKKEKNALENNAQYLILLAHHYALGAKHHKALKSFQKALQLQKNSAQMHQAYVWFLLDNNYSKHLLKELTLLQKSPKLQQQVGFAAVVAAVKLQKNDLALKWLTPLLKLDKNNIEYQVVYADLLMFQDREEGAKKIRMQLFKTLHKNIKTHPELLEEEHFARIYLQLSTRYITPYGKKTIYFQQLQKRFKKEERMELKMGWYTHFNANDKVHHLSSKYNINLPWLKLYLALYLGDNDKKAQLLTTDKAILPFRDRVTASLDIGDMAGASTLAFESLEENARDTELYHLYWNKINEVYPKGKITSHYTHLSDSIKLIEHVVSNRWQLFKGIESSLALKHYHYQQTNAMKDTALSWALKNSHKKFLWELTLTQHHAQEDFLSASLQTGYQQSDLRIKADAHYQVKTLQTPELQTNAMMNSFEIGLQKPLSRRIELGASYTNNHYHYQDKSDLGNSQHLQLHGSYILRAGYPDINVNGYMNINQYDFTVQNTLLPQDFSELGSQLNIGTGTKDRLHRSWRPYGSLGLAINTQQNIGSSLSLGISGMLNRQDALNLELNYSSGIGSISTPVYGFLVDYKF